MKKIIIFAIVCLSCNDITNSSNLNIEGLLFYENLNRNNLISAYMQLDREIRQKIPFDDFHFIAKDRSRRLGNKMIIAASIRKKYHEKFSINQLSNLVIWEGIIISKSSMNKSILDKIQVNSSGDIVNFTYSDGDEIKTLGDLIFSPIEFNEQEMEKFKIRLKESQDISNRVLKNEGIQKDEIFFFHPIFKTEKSTICKQSNESLYEELEVKKVNNLSMIYDGKSEKEIKGIKCISIKQLCKASDLEISYLIVRLENGVKGYHSRVLRILSQREKITNVRWTRFEENEMNSVNFVDGISFQCN